VCNLKVHKNEKMIDIMRRVGDAWGDAPANFTLLYDLEVLVPFLFPPLQNQTLEDYGIIESCYLDVLPRGQKGRDLPPLILLEFIMDGQPAPEHFLQVRKYYAWSYVIGRLKVPADAARKHLILQHPDGSIVNPDQTLEESGVIESCTLSVTVITKAHRICHM
jgi:hypothetical protein